jgi:lysophospholipase
MNIDDYISENISTRPTFFGCNSTTPTETPLLIYLANHQAYGQPAVTNTSALQLTYTQEAAQQFLDQVWYITEQGYSQKGQTSDPEWPVCLACAVVDRARYKAGIKRSGACTTCLNRYCWS